MSTVKQGEKGVSLHEQRAAIERYALRSGIEISEWFEERLTAAKKGRPLFTKMLKMLAKGEADGVVIHKIDRGARNLRDWAALQDLSDAGIDVHFANESVDLHTRGGRLSADIQAVVAADYIRNLREEVVKGLWGRLKQGIYPFAAPLGYRNTGKGRAKEIDAVAGPLVRQAFELYDTGRHTLASLAAELHQLGLRNQRGHRVCLNRLSVILNNPFYAGVIRVKTTGQTFPGVHEPLIPMALFKDVQQRLAGKVRSRGWKHDFQFRGLFKCALCNRTLIGEIQKGHRYYRCHTSGCPTRTFREEALEAAVLASVPQIAVTDSDRSVLLQKLEEVQRETDKQEAARQNQLRAQLGALKDRHKRLVDALLDGTVDKASFDIRKNGLVEEEQALNASLDAATSPTHSQMLLGTLELACSAQHSYVMGTTASRRELVIQLTSKRTVAGTHIAVEPHLALALLANRDSIL